MAKTRTYLDWNASAPMYSDVVDVMVQVMQDSGNASSVHAEGRVARRRVEQAREQVAKLANATTAHVVFTGGGSEANALALCGFTDNGTVSRILYSAVEHPSLIASAVGNGVPCVCLPVDSNGLLDLAALEAELKEVEAQGERALVSVMWANNETGVVQPVREIAQLAHAHGSLVHCDGIQAAGKIDIDFIYADLDLMSLSAHKIGGPQGVGALLVRPELVLAPMIKGGGQELNRRAGTENVSGIVGFGLAAELCGQADKPSDMRDELENKIKSIRGDAVIFGEAVERLPNTSCMAVSGTTAETLLIQLDLAGIAVSAGSACSSGKVTTSHVLTAMGVEDGLAKAAIRVSLGRDTTASEIENFINVWAKAVGAAPKQVAIAAA